MKAKVIMAGDEIIAGISVEDVFCEPVSTSQIHKNAIVLQFDT